MNSLTWMYLLFALGAVMFLLCEYSTQLSTFVKKLFSLIADKLSSIKIVRHKAMQAKIKIINEEVKNNFIVQAYRDMQNTFTQAENKSGLFKTKLLCAFCSVCGMLFALKIKSYLLVPVLGIGLALLPMWITRLKSYSFRIKLHAELSVTLSSVTAAYLRTQNFVKAVEENLPFIKRPVKKVFEGFLMNYNYVDKDVVKGIRLMMKKLKHEAFSEWCHNLIICQSDKNHLPTLNAIVSSLDSEKRLYGKLKTELYKPLIETITIVIMLPLIFPALYMLDKNILDILFTSAIGQLLTCGIMISILIAVDKAIKLCDPQLKGG